MGILTRFKDIMASNVHALFNKEDKHPEKAIEKYMAQLRRDLGQVKAETAALETEYKRAERAYYENMDEEEKFARYANKARENGSSSDARLYENKLEAARAEGVKLKEKYERAKTEMDQLALLNAKLEKDAATIEGKMAEINEKIKTAEAQNSMNNIASRAGSRNTEEMFSKMNEKADYIMDRANAMAELENVQRDEELSELDRLASKYDANPGDGLINIDGDE
ncbi:MAG: PspA/IM30 family protein [Eubacterium sp.]|nr:PspA/IM30 family protein [Eubacterium sp.]